MNKEYILNIISVFVSTAVLDWLWAMYVVHTSKMNKYLASFYAMGITFISAYVVTRYVQDNSLILPATLGAFVGTFIPLHFRKENK